MFRNRQNYKVGRAKSLRYLKQVNNRIKLEKQKYIEELDRLADIDLENIYADVAQLKKNFYAKAKHHKKPVLKIRDKFS